MRYFPSTLLDIQTGVYDDVSNSVIAINLVVQSLEDLLADFLHILTDERHTRSSKIGNPITHKADDRHFIRHTDTPALNCLNT